ncbi:MAG: hypothetical protein AAFR31_21685 [Cyanobacteria bacterium J06627_8]
MLRKAPLSGAFLNNTCPDLYAYCYIIGILYLTETLQIWHLYGVAALNSSFNQIQLLAYKASISSIVPDAQLMRANSMNSAVHYGSSILGPALAGVLYPTIDLE